MEISEYIRRTPITDLMSGVKPVDLTPSLIPPRTGPPTPTDAERRVSLKIDWKELPDFSDPEIQKVHDDITRKFRDMHEEAMIKAIIRDNFYGSCAVQASRKRRLYTYPGKISLFDLQTAS